MSIETRDVFMLYFFFLMIRRPPRSTRTDPLFPYTTLFRPLVQAFVGDDTKVLSRLRTATPLQVNLQVRIAEVNRSLLKEINGNLLTSDRDGPLGNGFLGSVFRGRSAGKITYGADGSKTFEFAVPDGTNSLGAAGHLFGLDVMASLDLGERSGVDVPP